jgi:hypothetical protein
LAEARENGENKARRRRGTKTSPRMKFFIKKPELHLRTAPPRKEQHSEA